MTNEHTDFAARYDKLVADFERDVAEGRFTPESVPHIAKGLKEEVHDLVAGFRDVKTGERLPIPSPLIPMAKAREYTRRLNDLMHAV
jgi:hypothetical protein